MSHAPQLHQPTSSFPPSSGLLANCFADDVLGYIFQKIILNLGYALSPLLIGFMAIPALKHIGSRYLLNLVGVLLWPWAGPSPRSSLRAFRFHDRPQL